jgi:glutamate N-acetyltransferase / amino-acid N-acetyltransferase
VIGVPIPREPFLAGIPKVVAELDPDGGTRAATAIMTTDTVPKEAALRIDDVSGSCVVGGMAKGAGMIAPEMATMLAVLTTDAPVRGPVLKAIVREVVAQTFGRISIDGCMSTNDTVLLLASGASGVVPDAETFSAALTGLCKDLARQMQADAEGVTKRITVRVTGAATEDDAVTVARTVARDSLVKTALFGSDPNWGRIAAAVGYADAAVDPDRLDVTINGVLLCRSGVAAGDRADADLKGADILVEVARGLGDGTAEILTTDLSHGYVEENSAYSS